MSDFFIGSGESKDRVGESEEGYDNGKLRGGKS